MIRQAALLVLAVALAACGSDESPTIDAAGTTGGDATATTGAPATTTSAPDIGEPAQEVRLTLTGTGSAEATLTYDGDQLCLSGTTSGVGAITGAHVHAGPDGEAGPAVVDFLVETEGDGPFDGCATVGAEGGVVLVDPAAYYVDLHTAAAPDGAVRASIAN